MSYKLEQFKNQTETVFGVPTKPQPQVNYIAPGLVSEEEDGF